MFEPQFEEGVLTTVWLRCFNQSLGKVFESKFEEGGNGDWLGLEEGSGRVLRNMGAEHQLAKIRFALYGDELVRQDFTSP